MAGAGGMPGAADPRAGRGARRGNPARPAAIRPARLVGPGRDAAAFRRQGGTRRANHPPRVGRRDDRGVRPVLRFHDGLPGLRPRGRPRPGHRAHRAARDRSRPDAGAGRARRCRRRPDGGEGSGPRPLRPIRTMLSRACRSRLPHDRGCGGALPVGGRKRSPPIRCSPPSKQPCHPPQPKRPIRRVGCSQPATRAQTPCRMAAKPGAPVVGCGQPTPRPCP